MTGRRLSIALAGVGSWGRNVLRAVGTISAIDLRLVVDPSVAAQTRAHTLAPTVALASDFQAALDDSAIEAIVLATPAVTHAQLAIAAGLDVDPLGISVDGRGRTSDPAIYAAGEVTYHFNAGMGRHDKQETWAHAAAHGEHVGHALMGIIDTDYANTPSYWTDQYDIGVQVAGGREGQPIAAA